MGFANLEDKINFCFTPPDVVREKHQRSGLVSVLYLLRQELIETAGHIPASGEHRVCTEGIRNRLFATLILTFTGFDILAKFQNGDASNEVGKRFKTFLMHPEGADQVELEADLYWAVRNSLTHAFGLPNGRSLTTPGVTSIGLERGKGEFISGQLSRSISFDPVTGRAMVYTDGVYCAFVHSLKRFEDSLHGAQSPAGLAIFEAMFEKYGLIHVQMS